MILNKCRFIAVLLVLSFTSSVYAVSNAVLMLNAADAEIHGDGAFYRHGSIQWKNTDALAKWHIQIKSSGIITVEISQGVDAGDVGSEYVFEINGQQLKGKVKETGSWAQSETFTLGEINIHKAGKYTAVFKPLKIAKKTFGALHCITLTGKAVYGAEVKKAYGGKRGIYFAKKKYSAAPLPIFADSKDKLPAPILDGNSGLIDMYWKCWEIAFSHYKKPRAGAGFVSDYLDEAFNSQIFQWDTIFMVMFARYGDHIFPAIQSLDNFYAKQHRNGFICREIIETNGEDFHAENSPQAINPPLFSWAEMESFKITGDKSRLNLVLPVLEKYVGWLETGRRKTDTKHGLYWSNGLGSGMDNTPRSGSGWVDMSAQMVMQYNHLADMCDVLKKSEKAEKYRLRAEIIGRKINKWMWNEKDGLYYDIDDKGNHVKWKTAGCFWPMLAGITNKKQEEKLIANLKDSKSFWRPFIFPTLAADQVGYEPKGGYWKGGVWAPTNMAIIKGLEKQGYDDFAAQASEKYLDGLLKVFKKTGTVWEFYAPEFFEAGSMDGHKTRPDFVGWTGDGPIALLIENIIGLRCDGANNKLVWHIRRTDRHGIKKLRFGNATVSVICKKRSAAESPAEITVETDKPFKLVIVHPNGRKTFALQAGKHNLVVK